MKQLSHPKWQLPGPIRVEVQQYPEDESDDNLLLAFGYCEIDDIHTTFASVNNLRDLAAWLNEVADAAEVIQKAQVNQ